MRSLYVHRLKRFYRNFKMHYVSRAYRKCPPHYLDRLHLHKVALGCREASSLRRTNVVK